MQRRIKEHKVKLKERKTYFILKQKSKTSDIVTENSKFISTAFTKTSHFEQLKKLIKNADDNVKLTSFLFDNVETAELLIEAADRINGGVYVLVSVIDRNLRDAFGFSKNDENKHLAVLRKLENSPVSVRCVPGLHGKVWIIDNKIGVITSSNLTTNSLKNVPELGITLNNKKQVNYLNQLFNRFWVEFPSRSMESGSLKAITGMNIQPRIDLNQPKNIFPFLKLQNKSNSLLVKDWFNIIHEKLEKANNHIKFATWSISLKGTKLEQLILKALERGVIIEILLAEHHFRRDYTIRESLLDLKSEFDNFDFHIHSSNHSKFIIFDDNEAILSTKNYDHPNTYPQSIEFGILHNENIDYLNQIWMNLVNDSYELDFVHSKREFLYNLTKNTELSIYNRNLIIWIWHPKKPVYGWLEGPSLKYISKKIENSISIKYYKLHSGKKILQVYSNFNLILSKENKLIGFEENYMNLSNTNITQKWVLGSEKIIFQQYDQN